MDVVNFFKQQVDKWNAEEKCGFCWEFGAPQTIAGINEYVVETDVEECCPVLVFVTDRSYRKNKVYNQITGLLQDKDYTIDYTFTLHTLVMDRIDTNVYNEQKGHPISESKEETILRPLEVCLCGDTPFDFCELICKDIKIINWNAITRINWLDNNYTGWSITMTLRDYDCTDNNCDTGS